MDLQTFLAEVVRKWHLNPYGPVLGFESGFARCCAHLPEELFSGGRDSLCHTAAKTMRWFDLGFPVRHAFCMANSPTVLSPQRLPSSKVNLQPYPEFSLSLLEERTDTEACPNSRGEGFQGWLDWLDPLWFSTDRSESNGFKLLLSSHATFSYIFPVARTGLWCRLRRHCVTANLLAAVPALDFLTKAQGQHQHVKISLKKRREASKRGYTRSRKPPCEEVSTAEWAKFLAMSWCDLFIITVG